MRCRDRVTPEATTSQTGILSAFAWECVSEIGSVESSFLRGERWPLSCPLSLVPFIPAPACGLPPPRFLPFVPRHSPAKLTSET